MLTEGQALALEQIKAVEAASAGILEILRIVEPNEKNIWPWIEASIYCGNMPRVPEGLPLRRRERFIISIPADFPFEKPEVWTLHKRFAGFPHVQWGKYLCLYQAPSTEWDPSDGMFGFLNRLEIWLQKGALDQLDPVGAPLHPPITYSRSRPFLIIPQVDTPRVSSIVWFGTTQLRFVSKRRVDIYGWDPLSLEGSAKNVAAAILLSKPFPFEFPTKVSDLIRELSNRGVSKDILYLTLQFAILKNDENTPFFLIIGAPMRGVRGSSELKQHLTAWHIDPIIVKGLRIALERYSSVEKLQEIGKEVERIIDDWTQAAEVEWCSIRENRPEIVTRRDHASPASWFKGKTIALWGCGAVGSHIAEFLTRAGVKKLILRDKGEVAPGLIVRQLFDDDDIGGVKVQALKKRLARIRQDIEIEPHDQNILEEPLNAEDWTDRADVIIDSTASEAIISKLEYRGRLSRTKPIPVASIVIGHKAESGFAVLSRENHTGGPYDVARQAKLTACSRLELKYFADEFWPREPRTEIFQPEPGCSDPTFTGSSADVAILTGTLLNCLAHDLASDSSFSASAHFIVQPHVSSSLDVKSHSSFYWEPDKISMDPHAGYEIRIDNAAWKDILAWIERNNRNLGSQVEAGGLLFGERDDTLKIFWVSEVIGPPPDSEASEIGFICGVSGTKEANAEKRLRSRRSVQYIGMWHTHPGSLPVPSSQDFKAIKRILDSSGISSQKSLLFIIGLPLEEAMIGTFVFNHSDFKRQGEGFYLRQCMISSVKKEQPEISGAARPRPIGLALSGGGARAIAFHLGCLRALHDRNLLKRIDVVSGVSGGAVIAAMYAYSKGSFPEFEERVIKLLRRGLVKDITKKLVRPAHVVKSLGTVAVSGTSGIGADLIRNVFSIAAGSIGLRNHIRPDWIDRIQPPFSRWVSLFNAFDDALEDLIFEDITLNSERRDNINIVLNATELRTGTAFRFGNRESGCWRFGNLADNDIKVSHAVAASAAFPMILPSLDRTYLFVDRNGNRRNERMIISDGGIYDNLGITCMEPGKSSTYSSNVFHPEYLICCNAGAGQFSDHIYPYWFIPRIARSFNATFRKVQNDSYGRLHQFVRAGKLKGFILSYLGQIDEQLPYIPPDLVRREEVFSYPTNFSSMNEDNIGIISARGEQLTRLLLSYYCPKL